MSDTVKSWIEERRAIHRNRHVKRSAWPEATRDWAVEFPHALNALEQVLELIEFMETDAENWLNAGRPHTSEILLENAGDLRRAIEGAINE